MIEITLTQYITAIASTALAFYLLGTIRTWKDDTYVKRTGKKYKRRY